MEVNLTKTQVIVFRNVGNTSNSEKFTYKSNTVKIVTYYHYLGLIFLQEIHGQKHYQP